MAYRKYANEYERFVAHVMFTDECWIWTGSLGKGKTRQYGQYMARRGGRWQPTTAHRRAYELFVGPVMPGFEVDHLCGVTWCVYPEHLEAVTKAENLTREWKRLLPQVARRPPEGGLSYLRKYV